MNRFVSLFTVLFTTSLLSASALAQDAAPPSESDGASPAVRVVAESGVGAAAAAAVWVPGVALMVGAMNDCNDHDAVSMCIEPATPYLLGTIALSSFTTPTAVYLSGEAAGGNGSFGFTLLGSGAGTLVGVVGGYALAVALPNDAGGATAVAAFAVAPLVGSIVAYELSQKDPADAPVKAARAGGILPSVGTTADGTGAMVTLSGSF